MFKYKVFIIGEAHMLTKEAFNALLKTLEEPPAHVVFILAMGKKGNPDNLEGNLRERHNRERVRNSNEENFSFDVWNFS